jgi:hypothetical protein
MFARLSRYLDSIAVRWDRYVVSYNLSDQLRMVSVARRRADLLRWRGLELVRGMERAADAAVRALVANLRGPGLLVLALVGTAVGLLVALRKRPLGRGKLRGSGGQGAVRFYRELLRLLARKGFVKERTLTPREFAANVEADGRPEFAGVSQVVESYYRVRYGTRQLSELEHRWIIQILQRLGTGRLQHSATIGHDRIPPSGTPDV